MARKPLYGPDGEEIDLDALRREEGAPTLAGVRQVRTEHPSYGLSPERLARILRNSETTDPSLFFALCMDVEGRELHYRSVLGTRKAAVAQLAVTVEPADDSAAAETQAQAVRETVDAPGFPLDLLKALDALGKGISWSEIVWEASEGQYRVAKLAWRDPRWFRLRMEDLTTGLLLDDFGVPQPLKPYKWVVHQPDLLAGIPVRNGLTRAAAWAWMLKNLAITDWSIFLEVYGHPLRLGKHPAMATAAQKRTLLNAVANLGSDAAAIIPEGMTIEFIKGEGTASGAVFKDFAEYFDLQLSKLVLGQTGTTDAVAGGSRGLGHVQNGVREDIERMDALQLAATLNRDLVRPLIDLNFGPQRQYPRIRLGRVETKDAALVLDNVSTLVSLGLRVGQGEIYDLIGLQEPQEGAALLTPPSSQPAKAGETPPPGARAALPGGGDLDPRADNDAAAAADSVSAAQALPDDADWADRTVETLIADGGWVPELDSLEEAIARCASLEEAEAVIAAHLDQIGLDKLAELLARLRFNARGAGILGS